MNLRGNGLSARGRRAGSGIAVPLVVAAPVKSDAEENEKGEDEKREDETEPVAAKEESE